MAPEVGTPETGERSIQRGSARESDSWFDQMVVDLRPDLDAYVRRRSGHCDMDDVVSAVLSAVWTVGERMPADAGERRAFVFGVARNKLVDLSRSRARAARAATMLRPLRAGVVDDPAELVVLTDTAGRMVTRLPAAERDAMRLTLAGFSASEGAAVLGCTPSAFSSRVERARRRMRSWWDDDGVAEPGAGARRRECEAPH
ncbi:hypothetical protein Cch01nite_15600 [Cellulomonas chitinilytica]|uniref:RNA polymerase sigma factor 70 region 4 type 2 domain-containing protein n=1 Tax=Cellulomonas chitinilytica TaxID=398759 RepID=A0A919P395_9CELL|nr:sigma factor-like helix-turn-helix DNA-binding protein [Cellulomonas chitinilytica]GIG20836.1 hypothetical protein Cch01nite_15600 [Cellulomonas chitinilytica]